MLLGSKSLGLQVFDMLRKGSAAGLYKFVGILTLNDEDDPRSEKDAITHTTGTPIRCKESKEDLAAVVEDFRPDLVIVACWYDIIPAKVLDSVPLGFWGIHHSLLPQYRGGSPLVWAMIMGEKFVGTTIFKMTEEVDAGPIAYQAQFEIGPKDTIREVVYRADKFAVEGLAEVISMVLDGSHFLREQSEAVRIVGHPGPSYCTQRTDREGEIDWNLSAQVVYDFIRAQGPPYPSAWTKNYIRVPRAELLEGIVLGTPGRIWRCGKNGADIVCGDHRAIRIPSVIVDGKEKPANKIWEAPGWL